MSGNAIFLRMHIQADRLPPLFLTLLGLQRPQCYTFATVFPEQHMPTISMFYGILIRMFFNDIERHHLPHIHAEYQGQVGVYAIEDGALLSGNLPLNKHKLVVAWIEIHKDDLFADWELAVNGKQPFKIRGLDQ